MRLGLNASRIVAPLIDTPASIKYVLPLPMRAYPMYTTGCFYVSDVNICDVGCSRFQLNLLITNVKDWGTEKWTMIC